MGFIQKIRAFFMFDERKTDFKKEFVGGVVTFLAMSYILVVNPGIVSGRFSGNEVSGILIPYGAVFVATALGSVLATILMALVAKLPVALAPGMGVNAFFVTIVLSKGFTWQEALAVSFIGGLIFLALTFTNVRKTLINAIPNSLKAAIGAGIGFFIATVGLRLTNVFKMDPVNGFSLGDFSDPVVLLSLFSIVLIVLVSAINKKISHFSFIISILGTSLLGIIMRYGFGLTNFGIPAFGIFDYSPLKDIKSVAFVGVFDGFKTLFSSHNIIEILFVIFAFVFVDIFDTAGTLIAVGKSANLEDEHGQIENIDKALFADAVGTVISSTLGTPEITSYVESTTGVESGARTGFSSIVVAVLFLVSLVLFPVFNVFTSSAVTAGALVYVGILMSKQIGEIDWSDLASSVSSFMVILMMVLTGSIADGIAFGFIFYALVKLIQGKGKEVHPIVYGTSVLFILYFVLMSVWF